MNITLYKAAEELQALLDQVDPETGEIVEGLDDAREVVAQKAVSVVAYIKDTDAQVAYLLAAAKDLTDRANKQKKRNDWLRVYLAHHMARTGITHVKDEAGMFEAKFERERDQSVEVFDAEQLPSEYMRTIPETEEPNKKLIASDLKAGIDVPGAKLIKKDRLTIR
jgi:hypothetical protein